MGLERDWFTMGTTTVTLEHVTGLDEYGNPTYSTGRSIPAIVQADRRNLITAQGRVEEVGMTVYLLSTAATCGLQDRITIPETTRYPRIVNVDYVNDQFGLHHIEVSLG